jgi:hypothetical protein
LLSAEEGWLEAAERAVLPAQVHERYEDSECVCNRKDEQRLHALGGMRSEGGEDFNFLWKLREQISSIFGFGFGLLRKINNVCNRTSPHKHAAPYRAPYTIDNMRCSYGIRGSSHSRRYRSGSGSDGGGVHGTRGEK